MPCEELAEIIGRWTEDGQDRPPPIPNLSFFRRDAPAPPAICLVEPSIILVVQGAKKLWFGGETYLYDSDRFLVTSLDLPANSEVVAASPEKPCLGLALSLDLRTLAELISLDNLSSKSGRPGERSLGIGTVTPDIVEPFKRLLNLLDETAAIPVLAPLIIREIHYRLLHSDQAARLRKIASVGSHSHRVARAIDWLKVNYRSPLRIEELAARVQMSVSNFHHHFRKLTAMSPLQYQKWLRLNEAKRLMLNEDMDATSAAFRVGYESPSQFSREYSRLFGASPKRDIIGLRGEAGKRI
jgi:AraC-like DNA-binding protein